jgi:hypothetical protein
MQTRYKGILVAYQIHFSSDIYSQTLEVCTSHIFNRINEIILTGHIIERGICRSKLEYTITILYCTTSQYAEGLDRSLLCCDCTQCYHIDAISGNP